MIKKKKEDGSGRGRLINARDGDRRGRHKRERGLFLPSTRPAKRRVSYHWNRECVQTSVPKCFGVRFHTNATCVFSVPTVIGSLQPSKINVFLSFFYRSFCAKRSESEPYLDIWRPSATTTKCQPIHRERSDVERLFVSDYRSWRYSNLPPHSNGKFSGGGATNYSKNKEFSLIFNRKTHSFLSISFQINKWLTK